METQGPFAPQTASEAADRYESLERAAETVTKEIAQAGTQRTEDYQALVQPQIIETAQQALFASLLQVHTGSQAEYETWLADHDSLEATMTGTEAVSNRAWHPVWPQEVVLAVSYEDRPDAAMATLRRQAFGQQYRSLLGLQ